MKTRNKTNSRFLGITGAIMVLILVTVNLKAQKSYNENSIADQSNEVFLNIKYEIIHAISESNVIFTEVDLEPLEDWMMNPAEWGNVEILLEEVDFKENELILENWMLKANWEDNTLIEEELQIEDWMINPATWNCKK